MKIYYDASKVQPFSSAVVRFENLVEEPTLDGGTRYARRVVEVYPGDNLLSPENYAVLLEHPDYVARVESGAIVETVLPARVETWLTERGKTETSASVEPVLPDDDFEEPVETQLEPQLELPNPLVKKTTKKIVKDSD